MINLDDAEKVGELLGQWQRQGQAAGSGAVAYVSERLSVEQLAVAEVEVLVEAVVSTFRVRPIGLLAPATYERYEDGRAGGILIIPLDSSDQVAHALRFRGSTSSSIPQLYVLDDQHPNGPGILFEFEGPDNLKATEDRVREVIGSLNSALQTEAPAIEGIVRTTFESIVRKAQEQVDEETRLRAKIEADYSELPYEEVGGIDESDANIAEGEGQAEGDEEPGADSPENGGVGESTFTSIASGTVTPPEAAFAPVRIVADPSQFQLANELIDTIARRLEALLEKPEKLTEEASGTIKHGVLPLLQMLKGEISFVAPSVEELAAATTEAQQSAGGIVKLLGWIWPVARGGAVLNTSISLAGKLPGGAEEVLLDLARLGQEVPILFL